MNVTQLESFFVDETPGLEVRNGVFWSPEFAPSYTPDEMLKMGVFEGKYINIIKNAKIPKEWYNYPRVLGVKDKPDPKLNYYGVKSRQPLSVWEANGWIYGDDIGGWFHWYIAYYLGRRDPKIDEIQIGRWRSFVARHQAQVSSKCKVGDKDCHTKQRQGLLQWGWNSDKEFTEKQRKANLKRLANKYSQYVKFPKSFNELLK